MTSLCFTQSDQSRQLVFRLPHGQSCTVRSRYNSRNDGKKILTFSVFLQYFRLVSAAKLLHQVGSTRRFLANGKQQVMLSCRLPDRDVHSIFLALTKVI